MIKPLKAFHGDSILVSFDDNGTTRNILIDGGPGNTYSKPPKALKREIEKIEKRGENIDLLVITHIDGIISMFEGQQWSKVFYFLWLDSTKAYKLPTPNPCYVFIIKFDFLLV
jgi:hypothetical protein